MELPSHTVEPSSVSTQGTAGHGDARLAEVYAELRRIAARHLRRERHAGGTFQATELVNECYLRLRGAEWADRSDRTRFFGIAARSMRQILVDRARRRAALKRPEGRLRLPLEEALQVACGVGQDLLDLDDALCRLEALDLRLARVVELRFFAGLSVNEVADLLDSSAATVGRDWSLARAWLHRALA